MAMAATLPPTKAMLLGASMRDIRWRFDSVKLDSFSFGAKKMISDRPKRLLLFFDKKAVEKILIESGRIAHDWNDH
jgi:hypothetical protein